MKGNYNTRDAEQYESYRTVWGKSQQNDVDSVTTIYRPAVEPKRFSLSSDDMINTSDEFENPNVRNLQETITQGQGQPNPVLDLQNKFDTVTSGIVGQVEEERDQDYNRGDRDHDRNPSRDRDRS